ncbi:response regulator [Archangium lipolyticum]|uniref:response regulator n=1 Tax=Archangium lipolyticum TaxID=2970465 RepID=UPI002149D6FC|nr:response regulator [Archangium lipolyticum]
MSTPAGVPPVILLVEDESDLRDTIEELLRDEGFQVTCMADGEKALAWLHGGQRPALVLLDFIMPRMNGWAFLERMRADPGLDGVPVVAISALPVSHPSLAGVLHKPFDLSSLVETARRFARG